MNFSAFSQNFSLKKNSKGFNLQKTLYSDPVTNIQFSLGGYFMEKRCAINFTRQTHSIQARFLTSRLETSTFRTFFGISYTPFSLSPQEYSFA